MFRIPNWEHEMEQKGNILKPGNLTRMENQLKLLILQIMADPRTTQIHMSIQVKQIQPGALQKEGLLDHLKIGNTNV